MYADDDTDNTSDIDPVILRNKIQKEADLSISWVQDNKLVCSGAKTKLLVVGTRELRNSKLVKQNISLEIVVDGCKVVESKSERLLGFLVNNTLTWEHHLYGNQDNKGLIDKLSLRAGLITKLSRIMPTDRLKIMAEGIFFSVLNYGIELYANTWSVMTQDEHLRNSTAYTKEDNRKLQVLVNKVLRSLTGLTFDTSTKLLHIRSNQLSVHQRCAYFSLVSIFKTLKRG